jgi:hypothetical protein
VLGAIGVGLAYLAPFALRAMMIYSYVKYFNHIMELEGAAFWMLGIPFFYVMLFCVMSVFGWYNGETTKRGMPLKHFYSYLFSGFLSCSYIAGAGLVLYFKLLGVDDLYTVLAENTVYAQSEFVEKHIFLPMFAYQLYNLVYSMCWKETRELTMLIHHLFACIVALSAMEPFLQFDGYFFFGMAELTNVPLTWIDLSKVQASELSTKYPIIHGLMMALFVLLFIGIRGVMWPFKVIPVIYHLRVLINEGLIHSEAIAYGFMLATACLTALQLVWCRKIIALFIRTYLPSKKKVD